MTVGEGQEGYARVCVRCYPGRERCIKCEVGHERCQMGEEGCEEADERCCMIQGGHVGAHKGVQET